MTIVAWFSGAIVGPPSVLIMFAGHMAVVIGLWPIHVTCTYRTLALYALHFLLYLIGFLFNQRRIFMAFVGMCDHCFDVSCMEQREHFSTAFSFESMFSASFFVSDTLGEMTGPRSLELC
jgi:hypothetical protein